MQPSRSTCKLIPTRVKMSNHESSESPEVAAISKEPAAHSAELVLSERGVNDPNLRSARGNGKARSVDLMARSVPRSVWSQSSGQSDHCNTARLFSELTIF